MSPSVTSVRLAPEVVARLWALPDRVLELVARLAESGAEAMLCGGTVRDLVLGLPPADLDLATSATPTEVRAALPPARLADDQPGEPHAALRVRLAAGEAELTSYRSEAGYDGRRPAEVRFVDDLAVDARRRDSRSTRSTSTPRRDRPRPTGGLADLATRRLRVIGDPMVRFAEDWLRVLRGLRLMAEHALVADEACWAGLREAAPLTAMLGRERVAQSSSGCCAAAAARAGSCCCCAPGSRPRSCPSCRRSRACRSPRTSTRRGTCSGTRSRSWPTSRSRSRPGWPGRPCSTTRQEGHLRRRRGPDPVQRPRPVGRQGRGLARGARLPPPARRRRRRPDPRASGFAAVPPARRRRFLDDPAFPDHLAFHRADCLASHRKLGIWEELRGEWRALPARPPEPLLKGRDLIALGVPRGPGMGALLAEVEEARLEGRIRDRAEAEEYVLARLQDHSGGAPRGSKD
ncbi:MAG: hypothetical protein R3F30_10705 [Planctomycetota bacterium]